jgi:hypothetical protein
LSCCTEMERKCSNRRRAREIRKTKYQSIRNPKPIHIYISTSTPTNTSVKLHILSLKGSTLHPNVEKHQIFKLLTFWDSSLLRCDAPCFLTFLWKFENQSPSSHGITPQLHHCTNLKTLLYFTASHNNQIYQDWEKSGTVYCCTVVASN